MFISTVVPSMFGTYFIIDISALFNPKNINIREVVHILIESCRVEPEYRIFVNGFTHTKPSFARRSICIKNIRNIFCINLNK